MKDKYITIDDYVRKYGVSRKTVYNRMNAGKLEYKEILDRKLIKVS